MKLLATQTDETSLAAFGEEAQALLACHDYAGLASRFGYALAYDRPPAAAIEADFMSAVASPIAVGPAAKTKRGRTTIDFRLGPFSNPRRKRSLFCGGHKAAIQPHTAVRLLLCA